MGSPAAAASTEEIEAGVEAVGLAEDAGQNLKLDQATLFRCVEDGNISSLSGLLKHRNVDINAYNDEVRIQTNRQADGHSILIDRLLDPPSENGCLARFLLPPWILLLHPSHLPVNRITILLCNQAT